MSIDTVIGLYSGFHFESELRMMNRICDGITQGVILSIGSYRGQMDCALALHAHVPVYCVDPHISSPGDDYPFSDEDRAVWMQNILSLGLGAKVRPINLSSRLVGVVWQEPIGLLFVDGSHAFEDVRDDLLYFVPHVVIGGLVAVHDVNAEAIHLALEVAFNHFELELIEQSDLTNVYRYGGSMHEVAAETVAQAEEESTPAWFETEGEKEAEPVAATLSRAASKVATKKKAPAKKK